MASNFLVMIGAEEEVSLEGCWRTVVCSRGSPEHGEAKGKNWPHPKALLCPVPLQLS